MGSRASERRVNTSIKRFLTESNIERVESLAALARDLGISLAQLALAWVLRQPAISSALIGASHPDQITENVAALDVVLDEEILTRIEAIVA